MLKVNCEIGTGIEKAEFEQVSLCLDFRGFMSMEVHCELRSSASAFQITFNSRYNHSLVDICLLKAKHKPYVLSCTSIHSSLDCLSGSSNKCLSSIVNSNLFQTLP